MSKIKYINPSDPGITHIARCFNVEHKDLSLLNTFIMAWEDSKRGYRARGFLESEPLLVFGKKQIPKSPGYKPENLYSDYVFAVALAQRRLKWEGDELVRVRRLIKKNYPQHRHVEIQNIFTQIGDGLYEQDEDWEKKFFNYLIDKLIYISLEKKELYKGKENNASIDLGEIDLEVTSGEHGFIVDQFTAEQICDLFYEAAITPWRINSDFHH